MKEKWGNKKGENKLVSLVNSSFHREIKSKERTYLILLKVPKGRTQSDGIK